MRNFRSARRRLLPSCLEPARSAKKRPQDTPLATRPASSFFPLFCWLGSACDENYVAIGTLHVRRLPSDCRRSSLFRDTFAESLAGTHICPIVLISVIDIRFLTLLAGVSFIFRHTRKLDGLGDLTYAAVLDLKPIRWIL